MSLIAHPVVGKVKSHDMCAAFIAGAPKINYEAHVFFGVNQSNIDVWRHVRKHQIPYFYGDNSYFDSVRGQQFRWTKNGVQIDAKNHKSDGSRFAALGLTIKPMIGEKCGHVVIVEQSEAFMRDIANDPDWFKRECQYWSMVGRHSLRIREWSRNKAVAQSSLADDLQDAVSLVTYSSAAAVTATLEGVPVYVEKLSALDGLTVSAQEDQRHRFLSVLADNQWDLSSIRAGAAWRWLENN